MTAFGLGTGCVENQEKSNFMITVKSKNNAQLMRDVMFPKSFRHLFEDFMTNEPAANQGYFFRPGVEITESEKSFDILVSLPGMSKEEIKIETKGDDLIISGERLNKRKEENGKVHLSEINYGSFTRSFYLPENVDKNKIEASYDHGMLQVRLPKGKGSMPKTIVIK